MTSQMAPAQRADETTRDLPGPVQRSTIVLGYLVLTLAVVALVGRRATVDGTNVAAIEVAGSADRVSILRGDVPIDVLDRAIAWDFVFIALYSALLIIAPLYFAPRAFRLQAFRNFAHTALVLTAVGAALDGLENAFALFGLYNPGTDIAWQAAATASWAKWTTIAVVALYAAVAMATYLITPAWVSKLLLEPPEPNVRMTPPKAAKPEDHATSGTPGTETANGIQHARFGIAASGGGIRSASLVLAACKAWIAIIPSRIVPAQAGRLLTRLPQYPADPTLPAASALRAANAVLAQRRLPRPPLRGAPTAMTASATPAHPSRPICWAHWAICSPRARQWYATPHTIRSLPTPRNRSRRRPAPLKR